ncbi:MAG TPA: aldolase/citrate lyase family protein [Gemmataceae bacterium]|jgi:phosphoglycerate dehydrogenase-like enzyme/2-keto-3-deoxy-L-rhamnonate aldolase RhmA|nr:aldolase/citrate lyase family protein [Gemmataceae bacterium]
MKLSALQKLRRTWAANQPTFGLWVTLEAPSITEMAVALGMDWVVIDAEHGHLDWKEITEHIRATVRSDTVALVRIAELNGGLIKRALDIGADGVVIPWIETVEQLEQAVRYARYPLEGVRGIGAERATAWGQALVEHTATANENVLVVPIIETVRGAATAPAMAHVDGVELFFFGPADFSASAGHRGQWEGPGIAEQILALKDMLRRAGKQCGVVATSDADVQRRIAQGFRAIALGMDTGMLIRSLRASLGAIGRDRPMRADWSVERITSVTPANADHKSTRPFRVALTGDFLDANGKLRYRDIGLNMFAESPVSATYFTEHRPVIGSDQLTGFHAAVVLSPRVTAVSLADSKDLLALGRFGVGFDSVDIAACTAADVLLFIAAGAVDRSVAEATIAWMLALSHNVRIKDRLVREARWDERSAHMGSELRDKTLGVIGFGGIGKALVKLLAGFGMNAPLVFDPFVPANEVAAAGARSVPLEELLGAADFVSVHCPLNEQTRNLIAARELALMKPTAYLINTARGSIVDEDALAAALRERRLAGAALDCFATEPVTAPHALAAFDNVLLAPHAIAWTDELFRDIGRAVCQGMIDLSQGRVPRGVVNPEVLTRPGFQDKWKRICSP